MASPTTASAAAAVMMKRTTAWPSGLPRDLARARKARLPALSMISTAMNWRQEVLLDEEGQDAQGEEQSGQGEERARRDHASLLLPGQGQRPHERGQDEQGRDLERIEIIGEEEHTEPPDIVTGRTARPAAAPDEPGEGQGDLAEEDQGQDEREREPKTGLIRRRRPAQVEHHQGEEKEDHDGPGIDQDLDGRRERRVEKAEQAAQAGEGEDEEERVVGRIAGEDHGRDRTDAQNGQDDEDDPSHGNCPIFSFPGR